MLEPFEYLTSLTLPLNEPGVIIIEYFSISLNPHGGPKSGLINISARAVSAEYWQELTRLIKRHCNQNNIFVS